MITVNHESIPAELKALPRWVLWRSEERHGKTTKVPYQVSGHRAEADNSTTWAPFEEVWDAYERGGFSGIGVMLGDGLVGIDFDGCRNPETGAIDEWARRHLEDFATYAEVSPTGTGVKMLLRGEFPTKKTGAKTGRHNQPPGNGHGGKSPGIEAYQRTRYFAVTGHKLEHSPGSVSVFNGELTTWFNRVFQPTPSMSTGRKSTASSGRHKIIERCIAYLTKLPPAVAGQRGHDAAYRAACVCRAGFGLSPDESMAAFQNWNATCQPSWSERELMHKVEDAGREPVTLSLLNADRGIRRPLANFGINHDHTGGPHAPTRSPIEKFTIGALQDEYPTLHPPVIDGLARECETFNVVSGSKIGKSWLAYYLLLSIVTGRSIFGRFPTAAGNVLLIDNELHKPTIASRIRIVAEAMGIERSQYKDRIDVWSLRGNLRNIFELVSEFDAVDRGAYKAILLDAKYRMVGDAASENDNAAETRFFNAVDQLAERTGATVGMIHHSSKGSQSDKRVTDVGAGAGAQSRAADCHLVLREHEEDNTVVLAAAVRSFAPIEPFCLRWEYPLWVPDEGLDPEELKGKKTEREAQQSKLDDEAQGVVLDASEGWKTRPELKRATGLGYGRLDRALAALTSAGFIDTQEESREGKRGPASVKKYRKSIKARA